MSVDTKWLEVDDLPEVINCVRGTSDKVWSRYLPERTCRLHGGECDQCGAIVHEKANLFRAPVGGGMYTFECRDVHYCPNCGAKVVQ